MQVPSSPSQPNTLTQPRSFGCGAFLLFAMEVEMQTQTQKTLAEIARLKVFLKEHEADMNSKYVCKSDRDWHRSEYKAIKNLIDHLKDTL